MGQETPKQQPSRIMRAWMAVKESLKPLFTMFGFKQSPEDIRKQASAIIVRLGPKSEERAAERAAVAERAAPEQEKVVAKPGKPAPIKVVQKVAVPAKVVETPKKPPMPTVEEMKNLTHNGKENNALTRRSDSVPSVSRHTSATSIKKEGKNSPGTSRV